MAQFLPVASCGVGTHLSLSVTSVANSSLNLYLSLKDLKSK